MPEKRSLDVVIVGLGRVGRAVVDQLETAAKSISDRCGTQVRIIGLADRSGMLLNPIGLPHSTLRLAMDTKNRSEPLSSIPHTSVKLNRQQACELASDKSSDGADIAFVDATADPNLGVLWKDVLATGGSVVLANKLPLTADWRTSGPLFTHPRMRYEATVGAGLPMISTLRAMLDSGDRITWIRASVSGTLAFLLARAMEGEALSIAVSEAIAAGYAEPDLREDLRGTDAARKGLILARTLGWPAEPSDVEVESLVPEHSEQEELATFLHNMPSLDDAMSRRVASASKNGEILRYIVSVGPEERAIRATITALDPSDPFAASIGMENRIEIHSESYGHDSLAVCGPGAGPRVTAMGVLADLVELARVPDEEAGR